MKRNFNMVDLSLVENIVKQPKPSQQRRRARQWQYFYAHWQQRTAELDTLLKDWAYLPRPQLAERILQLQHLAVDQHLYEPAWRELDRMRNRLRYLERAEQIVAKAKVGMRRSSQSPKPRRKPKMIDIPLPDKQGVLKVGLDEIFSVDVQAALQAAKAAKAAKKSA
jgi:hypothetical protein